MPDIKRNFFYSSVLTTANYIFPLITYPYVTRVLGVDNIGICNFIDNLINYFILISMMGISILGVREIATCRGDRKKMQTAFSSLLLLNGVFTILAMVLLVTAMYCIEKLFIYRELLWLGVFKLFFNLFLIEWFYKGLEDFRYITIRSIVVRSVYVVLVFVFVKERNDFVVFYFLSVLMIVVNAFINCIHSFKKVDWNFRDVRLRGIMFPFMIFGIYLLANSMYTTFNVVFLGFTTDETQVGYYTTATRIFAILFAIFSAFTRVMLPRMSALISADRIDEFKTLVGKSISVLMTFSFPMAAYILTMAPQIISLIAGNGYEGAVIPMQIVAPLIIVIGFEEIFVVQILMPLRKDKVILYNSFAGAALGVALNVILVGKLQAVGASAVWVCCELLILILSYIQVRRLLSLRMPYADLCRHFIICLPLAALLLLAGKCLPGDTWLRLMSGAVVTIVYYSICMILFFRSSYPTQAILKLLGLKSRFGREIS